MNHSFFRAAAAALCVLSIITLPGCKEKQAPDFSGQWAEKSAERIVAVFTPTADGCFHVRAGWREEGLAQYECWEMNARPGKGGTLDYEDGRLTRLTFEREGDTEYTEETVYTDGRGSFRMDKEGQLVWKDGKDGSESIFIRTDLDISDSVIDFYSK